METIQITLPSSKSLSNRWLVMDFLSKNGIKIKNLSTADDTQLIKRLLRQLKLNRRHNYDCQNAGTAARVLTAMLAITPGTHYLTGSERLCQRPMAPLFDALRAIGCQIKCTEKEGFLPVQIEGVTPNNNRVSIDCTMSSQFATALLLAAVKLPTGMAVELKGSVASAPYLAMTLETFTQAGVPWVLKGNPPAYFVDYHIPQCELVSIEKDWSAASFFYTLAAIKDECSLIMPGLSMQSHQGDSAVKAIFEKLGITSTQVGQAVKIEKTKKAVDLLEYDFVNTPDLLPSVAVACAWMGVESKLSGIANTRLKESDRVDAIVTELRKMKVEVTTDGDVMHILPSKIEVTEPVETYGDHRIAMAFAPLKAQFPNIEIINPEVVSKSFPAFFEMLDRALT